jgi:deoxyadenosine/deoxycytidine kinase
MDLDMYFNDMYRDKMDVVIVIDGKEGTGKSRMARIVGSYLAMKAKMPFSVPNIHFSAKEYIKFSEAGAKFQINVLDESRQALNKRRSMSKDVVGFTNYISENRDKYQVHIILLPAIHDLDSYVSIWRMHMLIRMLRIHKYMATEQTYRLDRGHFRIYSNNTELQKCMHNKNKYGYYAYPSPKYNGKMGDYEPFTDIEIAEYEKKKAEERSKKYVESDEESESDRNIRLKQFIHGFYVYVKDKYNIDNKDVARSMGVSTNQFTGTLSNVLRRAKFVPKNILDSAPENETDEEQASFWQTDKK